LTPIWGGRVIYPRVRTQPSNRGETMNSRGRPIRSCGLFIVLCLLVARTAAAAGPAENIYIAGPADIEGKPTKEIRVAGTMSHDWPQTLRDHFAYYAATSEKGAFKMMKKGEVQAWAFTAADLKTHKKMPEFAGLKVYEMKGGKLADTGLGVPAPAGGAPALKKSDAKEVLPCTQITGWHLMGAADLDGKNAKDFKVAGSYTTPCVPAFEKEFAQWYNVNDRPQQKLLAKGEVKLLGFLADKDTIKWYKKQELTKGFVFFTLKDGKLAKISTP